MDENIGPMQSRIFDGMELVISRRSRRRGRGPDATAWTDAVKAQPTLTISNMFQHVPTFVGTGLSWPFYIFVQFSTIFIHFLPDTSVIKIQPKMLLLDR